MAWVDVYSQLPLLQTPSDCGLVSTMARVIIVGCEKTCLDIRGITLIYIVNWLQKQLPIIGRGWAKYRELSVASRSIICRSRRLRQIIDVRDTGKSRYFVITEFNNCFIIRSPSLFFNEYLRETKLPFLMQECITRGFVYAWAEYYLQPNTVGRHYTWADHYF